jgi:acetyl esterase/lipase
MAMVDAAARDAWAGGSQSLRNSGRRLWSSSQSERPQSNVVWLTCPLFSRKLALQRFQGLGNRKKASRLKAGAAKLIMVCFFVVSKLLAQDHEAANRSRQVSSGQKGGLMTPQQLAALPSKPADRRYFYGNDSNQFGELRVPSGPGPYPVVILIHGGCWKAQFSTLGYFGAMADVLKSEGIATWNIEYRRLAQPGSGWPGTFLDVSHGVDFLRSIAASNRLDLRRTIVVGHSAGGALALWVAARPYLPQSSPLHVVDPLPLRGVIDLAGTGDMEALIPHEQHACGEPVVEQLLKGKPDDVRQHYRESSAMKLLPLGLPQVLVWGQLDDYVPVGLGEQYVLAAQAAGDLARMVSFSELGHFEVASPFSKSWPALRSEMLSLLRGPN